MPIDIKCDIPLEEWQVDSVRKFVMRNKFVDHNHQFLSADDLGATVKTLAKVHLTREPMKPATDVSPYAFSGQGFPLDPVITLEDADGGLFDLRRCSEAVGFKHTYGALVHDEDINETWLFVRVVDDGTHELLTAEDITTGRYAPIRIYGQSEGCLEFISPLCELEHPAEGEFCYSDEEKPVLISAPWCSLLNPSDCLSEENRTKDIALLAALRAVIAAEREKALNESMSLEAI